MTAEPVVPTFGTVVGRAPTRGVGATFPTMRRGSSEGRAAFLARPPFHVFTSKRTPPARIASIVALSPGGQTRRPASHLSRLIAWSVVRGGAPAHRAHQVFMSCRLTEEGGFHSRGESRG